MLSDLTTPSSTSMEKRWQRMPMPRGVRSSSRPSFFVKSAEPSAIMRILLPTFWSRPQAFMTNASLTLRHQISSMPRARRAS